MTDRHTGYLVTLDTPIREDDAEALIAAMKQLHGVIDVRPVIDGMEQMSSAIRMEDNYRNALIRLLKYGPEEVTPND